jgi:recombination protein RecA
MKDAKSMARPPLTPEAEVALIKKKLKHFTTLRPVRYWLDTGKPELNMVFGSEGKGIPYGKMIELSGFESHGKTAELYELASYAQKDGAEVGIVDLEWSWDSGWARQRGLDPDKVIVFKPEIGTFGSETEERMTTGEEVFEEAELWMRRAHARNPEGRIFLGVDSIAAILPEEEAAAGIQEQNMRTKVSLAAFLSRLLKRWVAMAANYNVMMILVNQLRTAPGAWGDPTYTPGGNAIRFYSAVRVRMYRKGKKLLKGGNPVGIKGLLSNWKNKAGEGSREGLKVGYKMYYNGRSKYVSAEEIKSDSGEA